MYPLFLVIFGRSTTTIVMIGFAAGLAPVILKTVEGLAGTRKRAASTSAAASSSPPAQQFRKILLPAALPPSSSACGSGLIFAMINIVGVEFLINFGGLGQLINELAERYDLPGTYGAILFVILASIAVLRSHRTDRAMAAAASNEPRHCRTAHAPDLGAADRLRRRRRSSAWEALAASGLLFRDVVPSLAAIGSAARARARKRRISTPTSP